MQKTNEVTLTGTYKTIQVTPTFEKQVLSFDSKTKDGTWKAGDFEMYIKPDLVAQTGVQVGDTIKVKGFLVFNFFTKQDGTQMSFPKMIANEVLEVEKTQPQAAAQPAQPAGYAAAVPPMPGQAPQAPQAPGAVQPGQAFAAPPAMPIPPTPMG